MLARALPTNVQHCEIVRVLRGTFKAMCLWLRVLVEHTRHSQRVTLLRTADAHARGGLCSQHDPPATGYSAQLSVLSREGLPDRHTPTLPL